MNYELKKGPVLGIFAFGNVQLKLGLIGQVKRNLNKKRSIFILLVTIKNPRITSFMISLPYQFLK